MPLRELTSSNFDRKGSLLKDGKIVKGYSIVLFHANWCGFCKAFMPIYKKFASQADKKVNIFCIDCGSHKLNNKDFVFDIDGFPTVIGYYNGVPTNMFDGNRTIEDLNQLISEMEETKNKYFKVKK